MKTKYLITLYQDLGDLTVQINRFVHLEHNRETELASVHRIYDACNNLQKTVVSSLESLTPPVS